MSQTVPRLGRATLLVAVLLVSGALVSVAVSVAVSTPTPPGPATRHINVPFDDTPEVWQPFRRWVVQEDGRHKPFDTFCRESVRAITGRERFEEERSRVTGHLLAPGHDPVGVVVSWLMLGDSDPAAKGDPCDWEHYPFLYCPAPELRELLREESPGNHVAPSSVRRSEAFARLIDQAAKQTAEDSRAPLPPLEAGAVEVQERLNLYDRIRAGGGREDGNDDRRRSGEFGIAALDRGSPAWFSLQSLRVYAGDGGAAAWDAALRQRRLDQEPDSVQAAPPALPAAEIREILDAFAALQTAYRSGDRARFSDRAAGFFAALARHPANGEPDLVERELWYNQASPFRKSWLFGLLAILLLGTGLLFAGRWPGLGRAFSAVGMLAYLALLGWASAGFYCRATITGRPPVSNMYESMVWVAFVTAVFGLLLGAFYRRSLLVLVAAVVATLGFLLADGLPLTFSPTLQPLQAVLRSNYWLVVHVLVIVSSYAPFALAWGLGNANLLLILYAPGRRELIRALSGFCYRAIQVGVLLLFLGTMLGGFWAAESWGRFWGWDPKEVWALIALLCYLIPLHARYVGWVGDFGLAACAAGCFASVVMAWYGVNFVLGAGLHSYGFGSGDHRWVYLAGLANLDLILLASLRYRSMRGLPALEGDGQKFYLIRGEARHPSEEPERNAAMAGAIPGVGPTTSEPP